VSRRSERAGLALAAILLVSCGRDYRPAPDTPPGEDETQRAALRDVYDVMVEIADLTIPGRTLPARLEIDLEIAFPAASSSSAAAPGEAPSGGDSAPAAAPAAARVRLMGLTLDASPMPLPTPVEWEIEFERLGDHLRFEPIEPMALPHATDALWLEGDLLEDGRRFEGEGILRLAGRAGPARGVRQRNYLVATTDYSFSGSVERLRVRYDSAFTLFSRVEDAWTDPLVRVESGSAFLLNRFELVFSETDDNRHVEWLSPARGYRTIFSFSVGDGANPQDLVLDSRGRLWISRYEPPYSDLLIADPRTGERLGRLDLAPWATGDGLLPRPDQLERSGDEIYVALQNADLGFTVHGPARLLVIDTASDAVAAAIELDGINPFQGMELDASSGRLYLAMAGVFPGQQPAQLTGGVEVVDTRERASLGLLIHGETLGGHPTDVALAGPDKAYVLVSRPAAVDFLTDVVAFDPRDGSILGTVWSGGAGGRHQAVDLESDGEGWLLVALRDPYDSGVLVLDTATDRPVPGGRARTSLYAVSLAAVSGVR
jgi:hypothetical protein